jgi:hypothetical protein
MSQTIYAKLMSAGPKFRPGRVVMTPGAIELLANNNALVSDYLVRHVTGDWGDLDESDKRANDSDLKRGMRLLSAYKLPGGDTFWIITDAVDVIQPSDDPLTREVTTVLLPSEY